MLRVSWSSAFLSSSKKWVRCLQLYTRWLWLFCTWAQSTPTWKYGLLTPVIQKECPQPRPKWTTARRVLLWCLRTSKSCYPRETRVSSHYSTAIRVTSPDIRINASTANSNLWSQLEAIIVSHVSGTWCTNTNTAYLLTTVLALKTCVIFCSLICIRACVCLSSLQP